MKNKIKNYQGSKINFNFFKDKNNFKPYLNLQNFRVFLEKVDNGVLSLRIYFYTILLFF